MVLTVRLSGVVNREWQSQVGSTHRWSLSTDLSEQGTSYSITTCLQQIHFTSHCWITSYAKYVSSNKLSHESHTSTWLWCSVPVRLSACRWTVSRRLSTTRWCQPYSRGSRSTSTCRGRRVLSPTCCVCSSSCPWSHGSRRSWSSPTIIIQTWTIKACNMFSRFITNFLANPVTVWLK